MSGRLPCRLGLDHHELRQPHRVMQTNAVALRRVGIDGAAKRVVRGPWSRAGSTIDLVWWRETEHLVVYNKIVS